ncbi:alternative ribosome rescue aminoacyl-tRNA hydrolase ArfB [Flavobacterium sp.]|uniref:alternative ribosome rescue aminoacyl-tRNA hydrolase ArfB n=1 Tax=Flavobacterium sp. TaxID=239 RepID=UPI0025CC78B9|nr:alternative ribosome rescue aminoacyl-tRNA hydrolase ArfB [Flavobacterium sp.]
MKTDIVLKELLFKAVRSSGAGGQNVNKVASKVVLTFSIQKSEAFTDEEKNHLYTKLSSRLTTEKLLIITCDEDRSQLKNKTIIIKRFLVLMQNALLIPKKRKPTKTPRAAIEKRIKAKRNLTEIKQNRRKPMQ